MMREITSKNIDGITDLVIIAPIKDGFIKAYENITYATRLQIVAEALHRIRVSAREHESAVPFSDTTERILTLLDFRVGVLDRDLFNLSLKDGLKAKRYLYLTATFDGAWEPYMRLIWDPLGPFLDLLFCNCEGYVTAGDHDFPQYAQWVRDHQMDSAIFYATTGMTVKDQLYLSNLDRLQREPSVTDNDLAIARATMPDPEKAAAAVRDAAIHALPDLQLLLKVHELALEALTVLFRLADFYPPEWLIKDDGKTLNEGKYLARVAHQLLKGWNDQMLLPATQQVYREPLDWYRTAAQPDASGRSPIASAMRRPNDDPFQDLEVQGGMLAHQGSKDRPVRIGALLLMTIKKASSAREFIKNQKFHFQNGEGADHDGGFYRTIGFTAEGLERIGLDSDIVRQFPKEFREGMAARSGLLGDMRENHPRQWHLPKRNWPPLLADDARRPPVELSEIDFVIQLRYAPEIADGDHAAAIQSEIKKIADAADREGIAMAAYELMDGLYNPQTKTSDHFGFRDGVSQPDVLTTPSAQPDVNEVRLGEVLCGYRNDRNDFAINPDYFDEPPSNYNDAEKKEWEKRRWRRDLQKEAASYQKNSSYLVVRKLEQHDDVFTDFLKTQTALINAQHGLSMSEDDLAARLVGRNRDGTSLIQPAGSNENDFTYKNDETGAQCPFASHIRRSNPRANVLGRPTPRIVRRGMSFGKPRAADPSATRGLMFMCYNASIAEQFETIQRWINGGNSTDVSSAQNDPMMGVGPKRGARLFTFEIDGKVIHVAMPNPFVSLNWGLYLYVPSRTSIQKLCASTQARRDMDEALENQGKEAISLIGLLSETQQRSEWKRLLEDFQAKDPAELNEMPHVWSAIRWYGGGSYRADAGVGFVPATMMAPLANFDANTDAPLVEIVKDNFRPVVLTASYSHAIHVLSDWKTYSVEGQLDRITKTSGSIYVTQQPDDDYDLEHLKEQSNYREESLGTNEILLAYSEADGFNVGYAAGKKVLAAARSRAESLPVKPKLDYFKLELRRQYLMPALGLVCTEWFGIPDWDPFRYEPGQEAQASADYTSAIMINGGWNWKRATGDPAENAPSLRKAQCPGDCLSPSRDAFYPRPGPTISLFGHDHGRAIRKAGLAFVEKYLTADVRPPGSFASAMFDLFKKGELTKDGFARNLIGIMVGAMPPMDGNLRGILVEWLGEKTLWRHQAALFRERKNQPLEFAAADAALRIPMSRAMCKRPAPDLIYRKARTDATLKAGARSSEEVGAKDVQVQEGDQVIISLVSVAQRSLHNDPEGPGNVSIIFGGKRECPWQGDYGVDDDGEDVVPELPVHACPAQKMAMGAMMGILAALLEAGRIQALPASLILKISDWPSSAPAPLPD